MNSFLLRKWTSKINCCIIHLWCMWMKKWFNEKILSNNKNTLLSIGLFAFVVLFIYQIILLSLGTYFNGNSDDVVQYSLILSQYIDKIKQGDLSFFNFNGNFGSSIFADIYYLPVDIFSLLTFLSTLFNISCIFIVTNRG